MSFVGIIADFKDYEFICKNLLKDKQYSKLNFININEENVENIKNIKFETVAICNNINCMKTKMKYINNILKYAKYLIINSDISIDNSIFEKSEAQIITYGKSQKATVTISSVEDDNILVCIQRRIKNVKSNIIELQEFKINSENITNKSVYSLLVLSIIQKLYV